MYWRADRLTSSAEAERSQQVEILSFFLRNTSKRCGTAPVEEKFAALNGPGVPVSPSITPCEAAEGW